MAEKEENIITTCIIIAIVASCIFMVFATYMGIISKQGSSCGVQKLNYYGIGSYTFDYVLNDDNEYIMQYFAINKTIDFENVRMCINYNFTGQGAKVRVRNEFNDDLGFFYITNSTQRSCVDIIPEYIQKESWLGVECETCDNNNVLSIGKHIIGQNQLIAYFDGINEKVGYENPSGIEIYFYDHCRRGIKIAFVFYMIILLVTFGMSAIFGGIDAWGRSLMEDVGEKGELK